MREQKPHARGSLRAVIKERIGGKGKGKGKGRGGEGEGEVMNTKEKWRRMDIPWNPKRSTMY